MIRWQKERKKESRNWMLETRSEGDVMNYGVTPSELSSLLHPIWTDGRTRRMRQEGSGFVGMLEGPGDILTQGFFLLSSGGSL